MTTGRSYGSPAAFRRALTDQLRHLAKTSRWSLPQLQRQIAYDRLLERLYLADEGWVVKGATALLARGLGVRETVDVDVFRSAPSEVAQAELREAAVREIGDWFRFEIDPGLQVPGVAGGVSLRVTTYVGVTEWCRFRVDLVGSETHMTGRPEKVPPLVPVAMPGIEQHGYRVYPLVDHIADKVAGILQTFGSAAHPSTRYKDLVDLVAVVTQATVAAEPQHAALRSEADRRGITLPARFSVPDRSMWEQGYAAEAARSRLVTGFTLDDALAMVTPFLNRILAGTASGRWDPKRGSWMS